VDHVSLGYDIGCEKLFTCNLVGCARGSLGLSVVFDAVKAFLFVTPEIFATCSSIVLRLCLLGVTLTGVTTLLRPRGDLPSERRQLEVRLLHWAGDDRSHSQVFTGCLLAASSGSSDLTRLLFSLTTGESGNSSMGDSCRSRSEGSGSCLGDSSCCVGVAAVLTT
jgi:hypothetical protein